MKAVAVIVSGLSDVALDALSGRTPLQAARIPALDRLASAGRLGTVEVIPKTRPSGGSLVGLPALLGYDATALGLRRGPLEAAGMGCPLGPRDVAMRLNFVSTFRGTLADTRAGHISDREARVLVESLRRVPSEWDLEIFLGYGYRHLLVVRDGADLEFSTLPPQEVLHQTMADYQPIGRDAGPLNDFLRAAALVLADHDVNKVRVDLGENPADAIWPWGEGVDRPVPPLREQLPLDAAVVAEAPLVAGLAQKIGVPCFSVASSGADEDGAPADKARHALELLEDKDLVLIHVGSVSEASRSGSAEQKVARLEELDRELIDPLGEWVEADVAGRRILVTSDHQTSVESSVDALEPVPFVVYGGGLEGVRSRCFDEQSARGSDLILPDARSLLHFFLPARSRGAGA